MSNYRLMPNEAMLLQDAGVAHTGVTSSASGELLLTSQNLVYIHKGIFGNTKNVFQYPLNQIKRYNGRPQVMVGRLSNDRETLDVYFNNGFSESFYFLEHNKQNIKRWVRAISNVALGRDPNSKEGDNAGGVDDNSIVGIVKEVGSEFLGAFGAGILAARKKTTDATEPAKETCRKKCVSCSAPLIGYRGQTVRCQYCDTQQVL